MPRYTITGRGDGVRYGVYEGEAPQHAVQALLLDAACDDQPDMAYWHVTAEDAEEEEHGKY